MICEPATWSEGEILTGTRPKIPDKPNGVFQLMNSCSFDWSVFLTLHPFSGVQSYTFDAIGLLKRGSSTITLPLSDRDSSDG
jgi:hypothetical protein